MFLKAHKTTKSIITALSFIFIITLVCRVSYAQSSTSLVISPPTFEINANPGDSIENTVKISNRSDRPLDIVTDKRNFTALGEEGAVGLTDEETSFSLASWIRILPTSTTIEANSTKVFTFVIDVPANAEPGGHFGSIVFQTGGEVEPDFTGAAVAQEIGGLLLVRVAGDVDEQAKILSFGPNKSFYEYGPVDFEIRVENEGNVHVKPTGVITISNMFGQKVASFDIDPKNVLPGAVRKIPATWDTKYLFGRYTATTVLTYGTEGSVITETTTFSGLPYKLVGGALLGVVIVLLLLIKGRKRFGKAFKVLFSG